MQRSSDTIGTIAAALAKAQVEITNPERSLTGIVAGKRAGEEDRSFRYAPLSSGLDIVRKTLGQHEIATVQTTAIDQTAGAGARRQPAGHRRSEQNRRSRRRWRRA